MNHQERQAFNDGVAAIYALNDAAAPGDRPHPELRLKAWLRFKRRTVGVTRYYAAKQANAQIVQVIRCPLQECVSPRDVAVITGNQYRIEQVQYPEDVTPPVMDLSLSRLEDGHEIDGN